MLNYRFSLVFCLNIRTRPYALCDYVVDFQVMFYSTYWPL